VKTGKYCLKKRDIALHFGENVQISLYPFLRSCGGLVGGDVHKLLTQRILICLLLNETLHIACNH